MDWDREQQATAILEETDQGGTNVQIEAVVRKLGLVVRDGGRGCEGMLFGREIIVDETLPKHMWNFTVAHEVGHYDNERNGYRDSEWSANYLAASILLPLDAFGLELRRSGRDLLVLLSKFRHASGEAIARRIGVLRDARVFVYDRPAGRPPRCYGVPRRLRATPAEVEAVETAFDTGAPAEPYAGVTAWPLFREGWRRVIAVSDPESLRCVPSPS